MTQTLKALNEKIWYRTLKVFHLLFWFLATLFVVTVSVSWVAENDLPIDLSNSYILCDNLELKFSFKELSINSAEDRFYWSKKSLDTAEISRIKSACEAGHNTSWQLPSIFPTAKAQLIDDTGEIYFTDGIHFDYVLNDKEKTISKWLFGLLALFLMGVLEFIVRHLFYYIALGEFFPGQDA